MSPKTTRAIGEDSLASKLPDTEIDKYLQLIIDRKTADAEKELEGLRTKLGSTEWSKGYVKALEGLVLTRKASNDKYLFFAKKEFDKKSLKTLAKEFTSTAESALYGEFDRGYFSGVVRLMKLMEEKGVYSLANNTRAQTEETESAAQ
jgi:hypothetical protein